MKSRVLIVDDDVELCTMVQAALRPHDCDVAWRTNASEAMALLGAEMFDVVLADLNLPSVSGLELCQQIVRTFPDTPVIVITGFGSLESAIGAIRVGAFDFLTKPVEIDALVVAVERAASHGRLSHEVRRLRQVVADASGLGGLLGESPPMRKLYELLGRIGDSDATVLISGESGTGKEIVARALHERSRRAQGPFVAINCAAVPANLLESELFGHVRGAYTDAKDARSGLFVQANKGTLLLDEIGEMPQEMQPKLLRVLQENKVRPLGGNDEVPFDVRLLAATNRDLEGEVEAGRFREDLYYRVNVVTVEVPPLRARGRDVLMLAQSFVQRVARRSEKAVTGISQAAAQKLLDYDWPGNVRELENCIERAVTLTQHEELRVEDLPDKIREHQPKRWVIHGDHLDDLIPLTDLEKRYILRVLDAVDGNKTRAAKILGLDRRTLYRKLERFSES